MLCMLGYQLHECVLYVVEVDVSCYILVIYSCMTRGIKEWEMDFIEILCHVPFKHILHVFGLI